MEKPQRSNQSALTPLTVAAAMITRDRGDKGNYLAQSIGFLQSSGIFAQPGFSMTVFHSGDVTTNLEEFEEWPEQIKLERAETPRLFNDAVQAALDSVLQRDPDVVLFFEDDVEVSKEFANLLYDRLQLVAEKGEFLLDLCTPYVEVVSAYLEGQKIITMDADSHYGTQCIALSKGYARSFQRYIEKNLQEKIGFADVWIHDWLVSINQPPIVNCSVPSLVQHVGENSVQGHGYHSVPCFINDAQSIRPTQSNKFVLKQEFLGSAVMQHVESGNTVAINQSAALVFLYCEGNRTLGSIIDEIVSLSSQPAARIEYEVRRTLVELASNGLIEGFTM